MPTNPDRLEFLDYLAIRPEPKPLESFGSYLVRTAQLSEVGSLRGWHKTLKFRSLNRRIIRDNPMLNFGEMARLLNITQEQLLATTFHYVQDKFLCNRKQLIKLLGRFLADHLRYCPLCLAETGYYQLTWRLLMIPGCVQHHCQFRDTCPHCGQRPPLLASSLKIGVCAHCGGDLANTPAQILTESEWMVAQVRTADWRYLLQPQSVVYQHPVEEKLVALRQSLGISDEELARALCLRKSTLASFERHVSSSIVERYVDYADYLGFSLREVLAYGEHPLDLPAEEVHRIRTVCQARRRIFMVKADIYERTLLQRVVEAVAQLHAAGQSDRQDAIALQVGVRPTEMILYPQVKRYLEQVERERREKRLELRFQEIQSAIAHLESQGEPPSARRLSQLVGYDVLDYRYHPDIDALIAPAIAHASAFIQVWDDKLHRHTYRHRSVIAAQIRQLLREAERAGGYLLKTEVAQLIGARYGTLRVDPTIHHLLETHEQKRLQQRLSQQLQAVEQAFQQLSEQNQRITVKALGRSIGMEASEIARYEPLWERTTSLAARYEQQHEAELLSQTQAAVNYLREQRVRVTLKAIGQRIGMAPMNLKRYPSILSYFNSLPELPAPLAPPPR